MKRSMNLSRMVPSTDVRRKGLDGPKHVFLSYKIRDQGIDKNKSSKQEGPTLRELDGL